MTKAVLWDLGGVLIDWEPARLYRNIFKTEAEVQDFLSQVCTMDWHIAHDSGVSMAQNCVALIEQYPQHADAITAWGNGLSEMLHGEIPGTAKAMRALDTQNIPQYALTNMPAEWWIELQDMFPTLALLEDTIVSAHEGIIKPDQRIYEITNDRLPFEPSEVLFFDDREVNVLAAREYGFDAEVFIDEAHLVAALKDRKLLS